MLVSYLYTPALKLDSLVKNIKEISANMIVVDLEDSIHSKDKELARQKVSAFDFAPIINKGIKVGVRINSIANYDGLNDMKLLKSLYEKGNYTLEYIFIPKVKCKREVEIYRSLFNTLPFMPKLVTFIETVESVDNADKIASVSDALCFGQADLVAEMYNPNETFVNYARARLCIAAAKYDLMAIDTNSFEIEDMKLFKQQCITAKSYGFTGKAAIHPNQVAGINEVFSISNAEIEHYQASIEAYNKASTGFVMLEGEVIAPPFITKAKKMLNFYNKMRAKKK
jgi:citrate lyase subunit beta/citryl-CoA lyase/(S)-citramalyl-CoA lyase